MIGSDLRSPVTENGNYIGEQSSWEVRSGGMRRRREDNPEERQGFHGSSFMIKVSHGSNLHDITLPSTSTFGDVKRIMAQEIGIEPEMQKLFFRGKEKEDCDYLQMAGVKENSKLLLLVDAIENKATSSKEINETNEISRGSEAVAEIRAEVDKLSEKASALKVVVDGGTKIDEKDVIYVTEMFMRQLLKLDTVDAAGEGKMQRKMEVRRIQSLVEEMDALKAKNSNPFRDYNSTLSVTTEWEKFDSDVESLTAPNHASPPTNVTEEGEEFD